MKILSTVNSFRYMFFNLSKISKNNRKVHFLLISAFFLSTHSSISAESCLDRNPKKEFFILEYPTKSTPGMFSMFLIVLGALDFYEKQKNPAGIMVNYGDRGFYYDKEKGENWWQYYFEPLAIENMEKPYNIIYVSEEQQSKFCLETLLYMPRSKANQLIQKYIKIKPHIEKLVNQFSENNFQDSFVIGIHYRGTDKYSEAPRVSYETIEKSMLYTLSTLSSNGTLRSNNYKIFIATDEQAFLNYMLARYGERVVYTHAIRSQTDLPVHVHDPRNYKKGEDAVVDCLLLSRCNFLIRTSSALSYCASYFNPNIPELLLNEMHESITRQFPKPQEN